MPLVMIVQEYEAETVTLELQYPRFGKNPSPRSIDFHVDDYSERCKDAIRATNRYVISLKGIPIGWGTRRRSIIAIFSAESEYITSS